MGKGKFRNAKCYCGSGKKYKVCHLYKEQGFVQDPDKRWRIPTKEEIEKKMKKRFTMIKKKLDKEKKK